jgi:hypothetical protein
MQLTGWSVASPYFEDGFGFDEITGNYTAPATGTYSIKATINYAATAAVTVSLGAGVNPYFVVRRTSPVATDLVAGQIPIFDVNVVLVLSLRTIVSSGVVTLEGDVDLNAGDVIGLFYEADGLVIPLDLGGTGVSPGIVWSVNQVR